MYPSWRFCASKRHTANLYGKLGVNKRRDAVIKAEALGIISPR